MEEKRTPWIEFPDNRAVVRRMVSTSGANGLVIMVADSDIGRRTAEAARNAGFAAVNPRVFYMSFKDINKDYSVTQIAERLGGQRTTIPISEVLSRLTVGSGAPKPAPQPQPAPAPQPAPETTSQAAAGPVAAPRADISPQQAAPAQDIQMGANEAGPAGAQDRPGQAAPAGEPNKPSRPRNVQDISGVPHEVIFNGRKGVIIAKTQDGTRYAGQSLKSMMREPEDRNMAFLRAKGVGDADVAAEIIVQDVIGMRRNWNRTMLAEFVQDLTEGADTDRLAMMEAVRRSVLKRVVDIGVSENASQESLAKAMTLSDALGGAMAHDSEVKLNPSLPLMILMRRLMRGAHVTETFGSDDLALAVSGAVTGPASSVLDLSGEERIGWSAFVSGTLARRDPQGRSMIILPMSGDSQEVSDVRDAISVEYGIEGTLSMTSVVADGAAGNDRWSIIFVGGRRKEILPMPPVASQRVFEAVTPQDLRSFESDVLRSRRKIAEFEAGEISGVAVANDREANDIQVPTVNMARKPAFTMTPYSLSGSVQKAQSRVLKAAEPYGGVEGLIANRLGFSIAEVETVFSGEQVDAVATQIVAQERGRGFLVADDAGVGKTRPGCAAVRMHLRRGAAEGTRKKAIYFVEKRTNIPDIMENLELMGVDLNRVGMMTTKANYVTTVKDENGADVRKEFTAVPFKRRKEIFESGAFPEEFDVLITPYTTFNQAPALQRRGRHVKAKPSSWWAAHAIDRDTLILEDEAHNSVKQSSNMGKNLRAMERMAAVENVIKMSATPLRDVRDVNYYKSLMPEDLPNRDNVLSALMSGSDVELESFMSMLVEDGVMIRRAQDISAAKISSLFPEPERLRQNIEYHRVFSPIIREIVGAASSVSEVSARIRQDRFDAMARGNVRGWADMEDAERAMIMENSHDSRAIGSPIDVINRMLDVAVKVDQIVGQILDRHAQGQRPLISFDRTFGALLDDMISDENGKTDSARIGQPINIDMSDQIKRILDRTFIRKIMGEKVDMRDYSVDLAEISDRTMRMIDDLPKIFSASPIDRIMDRLREAGLRVGEVSGRGLRYDEATGSVQRRDPAELADPAATIARYQNGELDVLAYNAAGATGINLEDSERFDANGRGQRVTFVLDPFVDVVKFVQGSNRTKRYMQLTNPEIVIMHSGLPYGEYNAQNLNRNLHTIASSIDGTREHPLLIEEVPDMFNAIGDSAAMNVLERHPDVARSTGLAHLLDNRRPNAVAAAAAAAADAAVEDEDEDIKMMDEFIDSGLDGDDSKQKGVARKFLQRLTALEYDQSIAIRNECVEEYQILKEAAAAMNQDPTKPQMLDGVIVKTATGIFSGRNTSEDSEVSAFNAPVLISSGYQEVPEDKITGEALMNEVSRARRTYGADIGQRFAATVQRNMKRVLTSDFKPDDMTVTIDEAMRRPELGGEKFRASHEVYTRMIGILSRLAPGASVRMRCRFETEDEPRDYVVMGMERLSNEKFAHLPSSYRVTYCAPGDWKPRDASIASLMRMNGVDDLVISDGVSKAPDIDILNRFNEEAEGTWKRPVQILDGNLLSALEIARRNKLGKPVLYRLRDDTGNERIERGIVVMNHKIDLDYLPRQVADKDLFAHLMNGHLNRCKNEDKNERRFSDDVLRLWASDKPDKMMKYSESSHFIRVFPDSVKIDIPKPSKGSWDFYNERPGLHDALYGTPLPDKGGMKKSGNRRSKSDDHGLVIMIDSKESVERIEKVFGLLIAQTDGSALSFYVSGTSSKQIADFGLSGRAVPLDGYEDLPDLSPDRAAGADYGLGREVAAVIDDVAVDFDDEGDVDEPENDAEEMMLDIFRKDEPAGAFDLDDDPQEAAPEDDGVMEIEGIEL